MSTYSDLLSYYANLLIAQFNGKPNADATIRQLVSSILMPDGNGSTLPLAVIDGFNLIPTVQTLSFSAVPVSGSFRIAYDRFFTGSLSATASSDDVLAGMNFLLGPKVVTVSGSPSDGPITINFQTIAFPQIVFPIDSTLLDGLGSPVTISVGTNLAVGQQLDWLGKYAGVTRGGVGHNGQSITLNDLNFWQFILIAIAANTLGSTLSDIQSYLFNFFPGQIYVFDYAPTNPMSMSYLIDTVSINEDVIQLALAEKLLPKPMGVEMSVIGAPSITTFFGLGDYYIAAGAQPTNTTPINSVGGYDLGHTDTSWLWMDYSYSLL